jgi:hypothetical protein
MEDALSMQSLRDAELLQQVDGALLEDPGAKRCFDSFASAHLDYDGLNPPPRQHEREQQTRRSRSYNAYLCAHACRFVATSFQNSLGFGPVLRHNL